MQISAPVLPLWAQWAQAVALLIIPCVGAWIAYQQVRIAKSKLNLDLFEKRFAVFEAARRLVAVTMQDGRVSVGEVQKFNLGVADVPFLFEKDVEDYLDKLRKQATALYTKQEQLAAMGAEAHPNRNQLADDIYSLEVAFSFEYEKLVGVFKPYLKLGNV